MPYPTDLNDAQWDLIKDDFPRKRLGRRASTDYRDVVNAILYVLKTGCQWSMLPREYPPKSTVHRYFLMWQFMGVWEGIQGRLHGMVREQADRKASPTAAIIDAQTVKSGLKGGMHTPTARAMTEARKSVGASGIAPLIRKG